MKLSKQQKEVIVLMRSGETLTKTRFIGYSSVSFSKPNSFVNKNTFNALINKGLIEFDTKISHSSSSYKLKELGKNIEL